MPYLVRLFNVSINNSALLNECKSASVVPIFGGGVKTCVSNYTSLTQ